MELQIALFGRDNRVLIAMSPSLFVKKKKGINLRRENQKQIEIKALELCVKC